MVAIAKRTRPAAVAGMFYPEDPAELATSVRYYLEEMGRNADAATMLPVPKAIIAPHAGYIYSGFTAAAAYNRLRPARDRIKRVIMMGPCHRVAVRGLALPDANAFSTPLGDVPIDTQAIEQIIDLPQVSVFDATHQQDHALEVHLPFLQTVLDDFAIVPMIVGEARPEDVAEVLDKLWGGPETLILISSDLSHYLPYDTARRVDEATRQAIENLDAHALGDEQACGRHSIRGLLSLAKAKGLKPITVDIRNSGDTAGSRDHVVGYGAWIFVEDRETATEDADDTTTTRDLLRQHGDTLLALAATAVKLGVSTGEVLAPRLEEFDPALRSERASFVTLDKNDKLRGCIGTLTAVQPLVTDIAENAYRAAFRDPRFGALTHAELADGDLSISVTVLSAPVALKFSSREDLLRQVEPSLDGIVLQEGHNRGVFLPAVWEAFPEADEFLWHLIRKASLPEGYWSESIRAWRFRTESVSSTELPNPGAIWV